MTDDWPVKPLDFVPEAEPGLALFSDLRPGDRTQCSFSAENMSSYGGCNYGSPEERRAFRERRFEKNRKNGFACGKGDPRCCSRTARYDVGGAPLCALHAGQAALAVCLSLKLES